MATPVPPPVAPAPVTATPPAAAPSAAAPAVKPGYATSEGWLAFLIGAVSLLPSTLLANASPLALQIAGIAGAVLLAIVHSTNRTQLKRSALASAPASGLAQAVTAQLAQAAQRASAEAGFAQARVLAALALIACVGLSIFLAPAASLAILIVCGVPLVVFSAMRQIASAMLVALFLFSSCATVQKMTGTFVTCSKADLGQLIDPKADPILAGLTGADLVSFVTEIVTANTAKLEGQLGAVLKLVGFDALSCAIAAVSSVFNAPPQATQATSQPTTRELARAQGIARAQRWLSAQGALRGAGK